MASKLLSKIRTLLRGNRLSQQRVKDTVLLFNPLHDATIREYYLYVLRLLAEAAHAGHLNADVVLGAYEARRRESRPQFRVDFQIEHTLVKRGGRGAEGAPEGAVPLQGDASRRYLVRVQDMVRFDRADAVIEYSRPNLVNLQSSGLYPELVAKLHYVAPLVYPIDATMPGPAQRDLDVITLFGNPEESRRKTLLDTLKRWNPACQNIRGRFDDIQDIYRRTRILVNIRQTDHHDTLEELRVLPALMSGVIVISEDVPLRSEVPYRDFIIWASLHDLPALVREVHENYEQYFERVFSDTALRQCLLSMEAANRDAAYRLLQQFETTGTGC